MSLLLPNSLLPISWLTEERPDKHRRRRICLGCGESFEYPVKAVPAVSFVAWIKAHLPCGEFYAAPPPVPPTSPDAPASPKEWDGWSIGDCCEARSTAGTGWSEGVVTQAGPKLKVKLAGLKTAVTPFDIRRKTTGLPECPQCAFVGAELTDAGICTDCLNDRRIAVFMERTGGTREEVQGMIDKGLITLRGPEELETMPEERLAPKLAPPVPPLNPAGDPCTFTTKLGPLLRRGNVKQSRAKKKPEMMLT